MKKIILIVLCVMICAYFASCGASVLVSGQGESQPQLPPENAVAFKTVNNIVKAMINTHYIKLVLV